MTPFEIVYAALEAHGCKPKQRGNHADALCPVHDDTSPSLSLDVGDDGCALLYCFVGCETKTIVAAIGLSMSDLFPAAPLGLTKGRRAPAKRRARAGPQDIIYAVVPRCLPETMDPYCVTLYTYLDAVQGSGHRYPHGDQYIADVLGWTPTTVRTHAGHLAGAGWIAIHKARTPSPTATRRGFTFQATAYEVIHNPARKRFNEHATTPIRKVPTRPTPRGSEIAGNKRAAVTRQTRDSPRSEGTVARQMRDTCADTAVAPVEKVARSTREVGIDVGYETRDVLGTQEGNQEKDSAFSCELDPDGDVVDASEEVLDRAPRTIAPPYDDNDLARLFADEPETGDRLLASDLEVERVCMTEDDAVAAILRVFPGAELVPA